MIVTTPYRTRAIRFLGVEEVGDWRLKLYGVAARGEEPRPELIEAARAALPGALPPDGDGLGFAIVHEAREFCFVLVDWWENENEVHQRILGAPLDDPAALGPLETTGIGCVWELAVTDFERRAWLEHILAREGGPDVEAYLGASFDARV
jgi:hypothetical protein